MAMENTYSQLDFMLEKEVLDELKGQAREGSVQQGRAG